MVIMTHRHLILLGFLFSLTVAARAQSVVDADKLMESGDFKQALIQLGELNRQAAAKLTPTLGKENRRFGILPPPGSPLVMRARALFERGFYDYLGGSHQAALEKWTDSLQLLSQAGDANAGFDLRRVGTALFVTGLNGSAHSVETFNRSLKATSDQIDKLPLPAQTDIFARQLQTEFEIYATHQVLASVFSDQSTETDHLDLWGNLLARKTLTLLLSRQSNDASHQKAYEGIFDLVFFSSFSRQRLHEIMIKDSLASLALAGPERYSVGLARLTMLQALFFDDKPKFELVEHAQTMEDLRWPIFSEEFVSILERGKASGMADFQPRLLKPVVPVLNRLILSSTQTLKLAYALIESDEVNAGYAYCISSIAHFSEEAVQHRFQALASVALVKQGKFSEALDVSGKVTEFQSLSLDEFAAMTYYRSIAYSQIGNYQASINESRALLKVAPHQKFAPDAQLGIALQFLNLGNKENARIELREYLARYPNAASADFASKLIAGL